MPHSSRKLPERPPRYADEPAQPYWPTFVEKLLLAIIDANPLDSRPANERACDPKREDRLEMALAALFGPTEKRGNKEIYILHAAMAAAQKHALPFSMATFEEEVLHLPKSERTDTKPRTSAFRESSHLTKGQSLDSRQNRLKKFERKHRDYLNQVTILG